LSLEPKLLASEIDQVRDAASKPLDADRIAHALGEAVGRWRDPGNATRNRAIDQIAIDTGFSHALIAESIEALLAPFDRASIRKLVGAQSARGRVVGFVTAGNVAGAGMHEVVRAICAGAGAVIKTASSETRFFPMFAETIASIDADVGGRIRVFTWPRSRVELTETLLSKTDLIAAYGDDSTIARFQDRARVAGFGAKLSAALVALDGLDDKSQDGAARGIARDATLFEQMGCLSPHHAFAIARNPGQARQFADRIARQLEALAIRLPPPTSHVREDAAAIRRVRETVRWRGIAGEGVELFEGNRMGWTLVFDPNADFVVSPGYRTLTVSHASSLEDTVRRLRPAAHYLEAIATAGAVEFQTQLQTGARTLGATHVCSPGEMQSPPCDWNHGGGVFAAHLNIPR
jgi:hypothetical protein